MDVVISNTGAIASSFGIGTSSVGPAETSTTSESATLTCTGKDTDTISFIKDATSTMEWETSINSQLTTILGHNLVLIDPPRTKKQN